MTVTAISKTKAARHLGIARSSLYYRPKQFKKDWTLKIRMEEVLHEHPSYGHKRLARYLGVNKKRTLRVMKLFGIKPYRRRGRKYRKPKENSCTFPNLLTHTLPDHCNHVWASDFTHLSWRGKTVYVATVIDIFTREIVGFSVLMTHSVQLVTNALLSAVMLHGRAEIIHSDQGSEYTSQDYVSLVSGLGMKMSMSRKASPWENGYQESFYNQFKIDLGDVNRFENLGELAAAVYLQIHYYNASRIHSALRMAPRQYAMLQSMQLTQDVKV
jgi:putative transposase